MFMPTINQINPRLVTHLFSSQPCQSHICQRGREQNHPGWIWVQRNKNTLWCHQSYTDSQYFLWWLSSPCTSTLYPLHTVPEVEGSSVYDDVTGQREGFRCEQHAQWQIERPVQQRGRVTTEGNRDWDWHLWTWTLFQLQTCSRQRRYPGVCGGLWWQQVLCIQEWDRQWHPGSRPTETDKQTQKVK